MFKTRSTKNELMDDLTLNTENLRKNLDELKIFNHIFGSQDLLIKALNKIHKRYPEDFKKRSIKIGDFGCGGGDLLRAIAHWAELHQLTVELYGFDANSFMIQYAKEKSHSNPRIQFKTLDILAMNMQDFTLDIICLNSICHHFDDISLMQLFKKVSREARMAVIINDLHRHWLSYFTIKFLSKICNFTDLAKHDAPLSVLRAFKKKELHTLLDAIPSYSIRWVWPFRWEIIIWSFHYD